jgi:hypothetical protein
MNFLSRSGRSIERVQRQRGWQRGRDERHGENSGLSESMQEFAIGIAND